MSPRLTRFAVIAALAAATFGASVGSAAAPVSDRATATDTGERGSAWSLADAPERVVLISDSAIAGVRWSGNLDRLTNARWDARLESCRRLVRSSCRGREGYRPLTTVQELQLVTGQQGRAGPDDVLVVAVGYNDWHGRFDADFNAVMTQARWSGFRHVAWLTYRENTSYSLPIDLDQSVSNYAVMNQILRNESASGRWPELVLLDYDAATRNISSWYESDGVHLSPSGGRVVADWLSDQVRYTTTPALAPDNWLPPSQR